MDLDILQSPKTGSAVSGSIPNSGHPANVRKLPLVSIVIDAIITCEVVLMSILVYLYAQPYRRGFFCDDDTIRYPAKLSTVSQSLLLLVANSLPIVVVSSVFPRWQPALHWAQVSGCEAWAVCRDQAHRRRRTSLAGCSVPEWLLNWLWTLAVFLFGEATQQLVVDTAKYSVGRLRPHFLDMCRPDVQCSGANGTATRDPHAYVQDYNCTGTDEAAIRKARLSFPSGHAALSFYAAGFIALFLERRFAWPKRARLQKAFAQLLLILLAWFTALSRVADHKHHWSDVLAGICIGCGAACFTVLLVLRPGPNPGLPSPIFAAGTSRGRAPE